MTRHLTIFGILAATTALAGCRREQPVESLPPAEGVARTLEIRRSPSRTTDPVMMSSPVDADGAVTASLVSNDDALTTSL